MTALPVTRVSSPPTRWTFAPDPVRAFVERRLRGRVLNLFCGRTRLDHGDEVVRVDSDPAADADLHVDATDIDDHFAPASFGTVVMDPPFGSESAAMVAAVKAAAAPLVEPGGRSLHVGYEVVGFGSQYGFECEELLVIEFDADDLSDKVLVVERKVGGG